MSTPHKTGLILTGGGARAAYQVGVLKAISEFLPGRAHNPFAVICGTSAGAFNAVALAVNARRFRAGVQYLDNVWRNFQAQDIYRSDVVGVFSNSLRWFIGLVFSTFGSDKFNHVSLLDNAPLARMLDRALPDGIIQKNIDAGLLQALNITASGYGSGHSVNFYQSAEGIEPWMRVRRTGVSTQIEAKHLLASSAIPFIFPAVRINREFFGDGSMRQVAPVSPALRLGATRVLVIGTGRQEEVSPNREQMDDYPSLARIAGHALDSIFLDSLEVDIERLQRINHTVSLLPEDVQQRTQLRSIEVLVITPSHPIEKIAERYAKHLPWPIRFLLRGVGAMRRSGANLVSYLLFDKDFCRALIDLGYQDAMDKKQEIQAFMEIHAKGTRKRARAVESLPQ